MIASNVIAESKSLVMALTPANYGITIAPGSGGAMVLEYTTQQSPRVSKDSHITWTAWPYGTVTKSKTGVILPQVTAIRVTATGAPGTLFLDDSPGGLWTSEALATSEFQSAKLYTVTTTVTPKVMSLDGGATATIGNQILCPQDTTLGFDIILTARRTDAMDESAIYRHTGAVDRGVLASTTALVGSVTKAAIAEDVGGWDSAVTADSTLGGITITVTGENSKTIRWVARVNLVEVTG